MRSEKCWISSWIFILIFPICSLLLRYFHFFLYSQPIWCSENVPFCFSSNEKNKRKFIWLNITKLIVKISFYTREKISHYSCCCVSSVKMKFIFIFFLCSTRRHFLYFLPFEFQIWVGKNSIFILLFSFGFFLLCFSCVISSVCAFFISNSWELSSVEISS